MTYSDAIQFLYSLRLFGAKLGLEKTFKLAALAGDPQNPLRFIHVAGTNGKGSTCAMLESIYRAAGLRVGLFTSPHLVGFAERIQINRRFIGESDVVRLVAELRELSFKFGGPAASWPAEAGDPSQDLHPTFFEFITVMALRYFAGQKCDLVVWETGLGGRLDATNIVTPLASVITNIGIEHSEWLGDTFEKIAEEKAGIIKPAVPVITAARPGEGLEVIASEAARKKAPLTVVEPLQAVRPPLDAIDLPLHGPHQRLNAATAAATVRALEGLIPVGDAALRAGLESVRWAGRMQRVQEASGQTLLLDGAHNPAAARALAAYIERFYGARRVRLIYGAMRDKAVAEVGGILFPQAQEVILTAPRQSRAIAPEALRGLVDHPNLRVAAHIEDALEIPPGDAVTFITGSLFLVAEARAILAP